MRGRHNTDNSTEDSVSSSSSPAAATGGPGAEAAIVAITDTAAATATATATTTMATTKAAAVRRFALQRPPPAPRQLAQLQHQQPLRRGPRRPARRSRRLLPPPLRDLAPSDESAEDADDEDDEFVVDIAGLPGEHAQAPADDEDEADAQGLEEGLAIVEELEVNEAEVDEDLRTSEEAAAAAAAVANAAADADRPWPATNDDFVEFSIATVGAATGVGWSDRHRRDTWRLFRQRRSAASASAAAARAARRRSRWPLFRRRSLPGDVCGSSVAAAAAAPLALDFLHFSATSVASEDAAADAPDAAAVAGASVVVVVVDARLPPELFGRVLREAAIGQAGGSQSPAQSSVTR